MFDEITSLVMVQGATFSFALEVFDNDGQPLDLTGCSAEMQVRPFVESDTVIVAANAGNGFISVDPAGVVEVSIPDETTAALSFKSAVADVMLTLADGSRHRIAHLAITFSPSSTR